MVDDIHEVSFIPLDIVPRGPETDSVFVIGWLERSSRVVVEEWLIPTTAVGSTINPATGQSQTTFSKPQLVKSVVGYADVSPVDACCYLPHVGPSGELQLLTYSSPKVLYAFDIETGVVSDVVDTEASFPGLKGMRSLFSFDTLNDGYIVTLSKTPKYTHSTFTPTASMSYYRDTDRDGTVDERTQVTVNEFYVRYPHTEWNVD